MTASLRGEELALALRDYFAKQAKSSLRPLTEKQLRSLEEQAHAAFSPTLRLLLTCDASPFSSQEWLDEQQQLVTTTASALLANTLPKAIARRVVPFFEKNFPSLVLPFREGDDWLSFVYLGSVDVAGDFPVIAVSWRAGGSIRLEQPSLSLLIVEELQLKGARASYAELQARAKELFGTNALSFDALPSSLPPQRLPPAPGEGPRWSLAPSVSKEPDVSSLSEKALLEAYFECAEAGGETRFNTLFAEVTKRKLPQKNHERALVEAAKHNHLSVVKMLLDAGVNPNARDYYGGAITRAITYGSELAMIQLLLSAGASANAPGVNGQTALFEAVERGDLSIVQALLEHGADPHHQESSGFTPLHEAIERSDDLSLVSLLLDYKADPNLVGKNNRPPLLWAVEHGREAIALLLLARGANPRGLFHGYTALHEAHARGLDQLAAKLIAAGIDRTIKNRRGIELSSVYGANGEDLRRLVLEYEPSASMQTITISAQMIITNQYVQPDTAPWQSMAKGIASAVDCGFACGSLFPPHEAAAGAVKLHLPKELQSKTTGAFTLQFVFQGQCIAPEFFALLFNKLLGGAMQFTGAGHLHDARCIHVHVKGAIPVPQKTYAITDEWVQTAGYKLHAWKNTTPFRWRNRKGKAALSIFWKAKLTAKQKAELQQFTDACNFCFDLLPRTIPTTSAGYLFPRENPTRLEWRLPFQAFVGGECVQLLTTDKAVAVAALKNSLRSLHRKIPIKSVRLTLPHKPTG